ncbi:MAG: protein phosphatase 2C domain-containing protein [Caenibius sp.]
MNGLLRIRESTATHVGQVRSENEDNLSTSLEAGIWVVADGMGGHSNGQLASRLIVEAVSELAPDGTLRDACDAIADAIHRVNGEIFERSRDEGAQMGSTVVSLVVRGREFSILWAGDSRAYLYRDGQLILLTRDHTQVEEMIERGLLMPEDAQDHPMRHVLSRAVGVEPTLEIDAICDEIEPDDIFLLCSDGLHGVVSETEIAALIAQWGHKASDVLISACLDRGAPDNVTVALVAATEPTLQLAAGDAA